MMIDAEYPETTVQTIAFGSCHKNKAVKPDQPIIWNAISKLKPDAFLWLGDLVYPSNKNGVAEIGQLEHEYTNLLHNSTIGYSDFIAKSKSHEDASGNSFLGAGVHATWDDHDYGANDHGKQMPNQKERKNLLLDFLHVPPKDQRRQRDGAYSAITFGTAPKKVKVMFLDTRSGRDRHCIPSVGAMPFPFGLGSALACITRWFSASMNLQKIIPSCRNSRIMKEEQWEWFEGQLLGSDAQVNIIVSSIQVLTSNKFMETWGQFPREKERLIKLLNRFGKEKEGAGVVLLSGDVHHGEITDSSRGVPGGATRGRLLEVTSSGLTHSCMDPFYGFLCGPILKGWHKHRFVDNQIDNKPNFYTGKNFGSIEIDWTDSNTDSDIMTVNVHDVLGKTVMSTGAMPVSDYSSRMTDYQMGRLPDPIDGSMLPFVVRILFAAFLFIASRFLQRKFMAEVFAVKAKEKDAKEKKQN